MSRHVVLIVDDNRMIREMVARQLIKLGVDSEIAINGIDAIEKLSRRDYHVVLMDVQMPQMDGMAATKEIRRSEEGSPKRTIIIALTGHGSRADCLATGMDDFIAKPMNLSTVRAALEKWIPNFQIDSDKAASSISSLP